MNPDSSKRFPTPESLRDYLQWVVDGAMHAEFIWPIGDCFVTTELRKEVMTGLEGPYIITGGIEYEVLFKDKKGGVWQVSLQKLGQPKVSIAYSPMERK